MGGRKDFITELFREMSVKILAEHKSPSEAHHWAKKEM